MSSKQAETPIQFYPTDGYFITRSAVRNAREKGECHFASMLEVNTDEHAPSKHKPSAKLNDGVLLYIQSGLKDYTKSVITGENPTKKKAREKMIGDGIIMTARQELTNTRDPAKINDLNDIITHAYSWADALYMLPARNDEIKQDKNVIAEWWDELKRLKTASSAQHMIPKIVRDKAVEAMSRGLTSIAIIGDTEVDGSCAYPESSSVLLHPRALKNPAAKLEFYKNVLRCCRLTPEEFESACQELENSARGHAGSKGASKGPPPPIPPYKPKAYQIEAPAEGAYKLIIKYKPNHFGSSYWANMETGDTRGTIASMDPIKMRAKKETRQTVLRMKYLFGETEAVRQAVDAHIPEHRALADVLLGEEVLQRARYGCMRYPHGESEDTGAPPSLSQRSKKQLEGAILALITKNESQLEEGVSEYYHLLQGKLAQAPALMIAALGSDDQLRRLKTIHKLEAAVDPEATPLQSETIRCERAALFNEVMQENGIPLEASMDALSHANTVGQVDRAGAMAK